MRQVLSRPPVCKAEGNFYTLSFQRFVRLNCLQKNKLQVFLRMEVMLMAVPPSATVWQIPNVKATVQGKVIAHMVFFKLPTFVLQKMVTTGTISFKTIQIPYAFQLPLSCWGRGEGKLSGYAKILYHVKPWWCTGNTPLPLVTACFIPNKEDGIICQKYFMEFTYICFGQVMADCKQKKNLKAFLKCIIFLVQK